MLDGRIARLTNTTSAFGVEFDSLADVISFGAAPAMLAFCLGPDGTRADRLGRRVHLSERRGHAPGAIQHPDVGAGRQALFHRHADAGGGRRRRRRPCMRGRVLPDVARRLRRAVTLMLVPAALMVSTIRFRSFKTINFGWGPSYLPLLAFVAARVVRRDRAADHAAAAGVQLLVSGFVELAITRAAGAAGGAAGSVIVTVVPTPARLDE